jgi:hypothetical protein
LASSKKRLIDSIHAASLNAIPSLIILANQIRVNESEVIQCLFDRFAARVSSEGAGTLKTMIDVFDSVIKTGFTPVAEPERLRPVLMAMSSMFRPDVFDLGESQSRLLMGILCHFILHGVEWQKLDEELLAPIQTQLSRILDYVSMRPIDTDWIHEYFFYLTMCPKIAERNANAAREFLKHLNNFNAKRHIVSLHRFRAFYPQIALDAHPKALELLSMRPGEKMSARSFIHAAAMRSLLSDIKKSAALADIDIVQWCEAGYTVLDIAFRSKVDKKLVIGLDFLDEDALALNKRDDIFAGALAKRLYLQQIGCREYVWILLNEKTMENTKEYIEIISKKLQNWHAEQSNAAVSNAP